MRREGYSTLEIYDVLTGAGLPWQEIQLLIERVEIELKGMKFEERPTQLKLALESALEEFREELNLKLEILDKKISALQRRR